MHAFGLEREYVERAIEGGLKILGFSDHAPYPFPKTYYSGFRMRMRELEYYVKTVIALREEYRKDIQIHLGLEAEYYPDYFSEFLEAISGYPIEYLLLGQHFLGNEIGDFYSGAATRNPVLLERYCNQTKEAMETGAFSYLAHPDLIHFIGDDAVYDKSIRPLCQSAKACGIPLEINFLGISDKRNYPDERFWKIAGEEGCSVIFGADAHDPQSVWNPEALKKAEQLVQKYRLNLTETLVLRRPGQNG